MEHADDGDNEQEQDNEVQQEHAKKCEKFKQTNGQPRAKATGGAAGQTSAVVARVMAAAEPPEPERFE